MLTGEAREGERMADILEIKTPNFEFELTKRHIMLADILIEAIYASK